MLQIAMCDDDDADLSFLSDMVGLYCSTYEVEADYTCFPSGSALLSAVTAGCRFDICLLDIIMPHQDGIETARRLRSLMPEMELVYLTTSQEFSLEAYSVHALEYLVKPYTQHQLFTALTRAIAFYHAKKMNPYPLFPLPAKEGLFRVNCREILYVQSQNKVLKFYMEDGRMLKTANSSMTLNQAARRLMRCGGFFMPNRSHIVNLAAVLEVTRDYLELSNGTQIPVPRRKYSQIKRAFLDFLLKNGGETF